MGNFHAMYLERVAYNYFSLPLNVHSKGNARIQFIFPVDILVDYLKAQMIAFDTDIHAVAGLLKRYFRELPDPLFTEALYSSFVQVLGE